MNTKKKVLFLFLALIILIVSCVYTHIDDFKIDDNSLNIKVKEKVITSSTLDSITNKVKSFFVDDDIKEEVEETNVEESIDVTKESPLKIKEEENSTEQTIDTTESSEITEEPEELVKPLISTDKRYKRVGSERNIEELSNEAQLLQIKMSEYVKTNPIIFKSGSNKIRKQSNKTIKSVVKALKEFPTIKIEVAGHTDAIGAANLNKRISKQRARSVRNRLISYGIEKNRIKARGYGEDIPLVENSTNGYSKKNRRVEFNIVEE